MKKILGAVTFEWDKGNIDKNRKHGVTNEESEEVFDDEDKVIHKDLIHSQKEERFIVLGKTQKGQLLFVVYTARGSKVRIISARRVNKKEVLFYEKAT